MVVEGERVVPRGTSEGGNDVTFPQVLGPLFYFKEDLRFTVLERVRALGLPKAGLTRVWTGPHSMELDVRSVQHLVKTYRGREEVIEEHPREKCLER